MGLLIIILSKAKRSTKRTSPRKFHRSNLDGGDLHHESKQAVKVHLNLLEATREQGRTARLKKQVESEEPEIRQFRAGDLVLLRNVYLDKVHGRKLRAKGPYEVNRILSKNRSVVLVDLSSGMRVGKHHMDHIKRFVPRTDNPREEAKEVAERNRQQDELYKGFDREEKELVKEERLTML